MDEEGVVLLEQRPGNCLRDQVVRGKDFSFP